MRNFSDSTLWIISFLIVLAVAIVFAGFAEGCGLSDWFKIPVFALIGWMRGSIHARMRGRHV